MRMTESKLRSIIRKIILENSDVPVGEDESSKPILTTKEEISKAFKSVVDSDKKYEIKNKIKEYIDKKEKGQTGSIAMTLGKKLRIAYREKYKIDLTPKDFISGINTGLQNYINGLKKK